MIILLIISGLLNIALLYAARNSLYKIEKVESALQDIYDKLTFTLHTMRVIDEKQMFENDDEVGTVFVQLTDVINELRPIIYGSIQTNGSEETNTR
jgi:archaellum component FlaF (FlaF/FlaG flagellin family)